MRKTILFSTTKSLDEFRRVAELAKEIGATHVRVTQIEKAMWEWNEDRYDPYPNWGIGSATIFRIIVPEKLKKYLPVDYANRNLELIEKKAEILKEYGLKAAYFGNEPFYLPESVYEDHPEWRGPQCEPPRRARKDYYAPCLHNPEVREMYVQAVKQLCTAAPIEYFKFTANDSGSGLCWSDWLYPGPNGSRSCAHLSKGEQVTNFLSVIQEGAALAGLEAEAGFQGRFSEGEVTAVAPVLKNGQFILNRTKDGKINDIVAGVRFPYRDGTYPVCELPQVVKYAETFQTVAADKQSSIVIHLSSVNNKEQCDLLKMAFNKIEDGPLARYRVLTELAKSYVGEKSADKLVEVWDLLDRGVEMSYSHMHFGGHILNIGGVHQRWITRPFVPFPNELAPEEKDYYRQFQFQAGKEEEADNLLCMQGNKPIAGHSGMMMVLKTGHACMNLYKKAISLIKAIINETGDIPYKNNLQTLLLKFRMYICLWNNAINACRFQVILDRTDYSIEPKDESDANFEQGDVRFYEIKKVFREEISNTLEMIEILQSTDEPILNLADTSESEDVKTLGPDIVDCLKKKVRIMEKHRDDFRRLYMSYNR